MKINQAVILCGGLGSRLGNITKITPKPLIKIANHLFIEILIKNLSRHHVKETFLLCSYKHEIFFKKYHKKKIGNCKILCVKEKKPLGTIGGLNLIENKLNGNFFLLNGDTFFEINYIDFARFFINFSKNKVGAIAGFERKGKRFNHIKIFKNFNLVFPFKNSHQINAGTYIFNKKIFKYLKKGYNSLENNILPILSKKKLLIGKEYKLKNTKFIDIGIPKDLQIAKQLIPKFFLEKKAVFLDRDGVLNHDFGYVSEVKRFKWKQNAIKSIKYLNDNNFLVFLVTNQSGIGRGYYTIKKFKKLCLWMESQLYNNGAHIDDIFFSPYFNKGKFSKRKYLNLRKPNIGMYLESKKKWNFNVNKSFMIGDSAVDKEFAINTNLKFFNSIKNKFWYKKIK